MKAALQNLATSFRLRFTLFLVLIMGVLVGAYGYAVSRKLEAIAVERVERRLIGAAARGIPRLRMERDLPRVGPARDHREREAYAGFLSDTGMWRPTWGEWPEPLVAVWRDWLDEKGPGMSLLTVPRGPPRAVPDRRGGGPGPGAIGELPPPEIEKLVRKEFTVEGQPWLVLSGRLDDGFVVFSANIQDERATTSDLGRVQTVYLPALMLILLVVGWIFATRALLPVRRLSSAMAVTSGNTLGTQLPMEGAASEFRELIGVFNAMTERLQRSFQQASRFSADAAHELKTPLTVLQGELEAALHAEAPGSEAQQQHRSMLDEVSRLRGITERLLLLARADAGSLLGEQTELAMELIVRELIEDLEVTSPGLTVRTELEAFRTRGDPFLLRQALHNLLSNAEKYNCPDGWISVRLAMDPTSGGRRFLIEVGNAGEPIAEAAQPHLFDRFYRVDTARSREVGGFGLGLSLSREIARAHGGDLILVHSRVEGTLFRLTLPIGA